MKKIIKPILMIFLVIFCVTLTSCYKRETFIFKEGKYEYSGEEFEFYDGISISYISISFDLVDEEDTYNDNLILNRKNNKSYYMDFYIENGEDEGFHCDFADLDKVGDQVDRYYIDVDISQLINTDYAILTLILELHNSNYTQDKTQNSAIKIEITVEHLKLNNDYRSYAKYNFPNYMELDYVEEEYDEKD